MTPIFFLIMLIITHEPNKYHRGGSVRNGAGHCDHNCGHDKRMFYNYAASSSICRNYCKISISCVGTNRRIHVL